MKYFITKTIYTFLMILNLSDAAYGIITNENEVTDFFDQSINNKEDVYEITRDLRQSGLQGIKDKSSISKVEGHKDISAKENEMSQIKAIDLDNAGRDKRREDYQYYDDNEFEVDFEKPSNQLHLDHAKTLSDKSDELMDEIITSFKDFDIDCKTVKGPIEKEPTYYIEMERQEEKPNSHYDQYFCENLRNTYNCTDSASIRCLKKGWSHPWEKGEREMRFSHSDITSRGWHYSVHWKRKRHGVHFNAPGPEIRKEVAKRLKVGIENINPALRVIARGNGEPYHQIWPQFFAWNTYSIFYSYRDGEEICEQWSDPDWTERCVLNG